MSEERIENTGGTNPQEHMKPSPKAPQAPNPPTAEQEAPVVDARIEKLQDAFGMIDNEFIEEALPESAEDAPKFTAVAGGKKKRNWVAIAAGGIGAIVVIWVVAQIIAGITMFSFNSITTVDGDSSSKTTSSTGGVGGGIGWKPSDMINSTSTGSSGATSSSDSSRHFLGFSETSDLDSDSSSSYDSSLRSSEDTGWSSDVATDTKSSSDTTSSSSSSGSTGYTGAQNGKRFLLTAGAWNDNKNWPFFSNLVDAGRLTFPSYGLDPVRRVQVTLKNGDTPARNKVVELRNGDATYWKAKTNKDGVAYLFYAADEHPNAIKADGSWHDVSIPDNSGQGGAKTQSNEFEFQVGDAGSVKGVQVMFILDTTGSMSDELSYLQSDFGAIAQDVGTDGVSYSANFYRDEGDAYVVKAHGFTSNADEVKAQFAAENADGGGDTPEAVEQVLRQCIRQNGQWDDDYAHIAFLIFDAPPHDGTDASIRESIAAAAEKGIKLVPVIASNPERGTEMFGRGCAVMTGADYVFLTDDSGIGDSHLDPIIGDYTPEKLHDVIVRLIQAER